MEVNLVLTSNGKEVTIPVSLPEEVVKSLASPSKKNSIITGWEKPEEGDTFYYIDAAGRVQDVVVTEGTKLQMEVLYEDANCYVDRELAIDMARANKLLRELRRFAAIHDDNGSPSRRNKGYTITYNYVDRCLEIGMAGQWLALGDIAFSTEDMAREAISTFAEELNWYFTNMHDRILTPGVE